MPSRARCHRRSGSASPGWIRAGLRRHIVVVADLPERGGLDDAARRWAPGALQPVAAAVADTANVVSLFGDQKAAPSGPLAAESTEVRFADIGGLNAVKQQIRRKTITPFEKPALFQTFRKRAGGGVLLYGPPAAARPCWPGQAQARSARFFPAAITDVLNKWIGESERELAAIFAQARAAAPAVLLFDEIEALTSQSRERGCRRIAARLREWFSHIDGNATASTVVGALVPDFQFPDWYASIIASAGQKGGSAIEWPANRREKLGQVLALFRRFADTPDEVLQFGLPPADSK